MEERIEAISIRAANEDYAEKFYTLKLILVGDTHTGKSSLITSYLNYSFKENANENTVLDVYRGTKKVKSQDVVVEIIDTAGDLEKDRESR